MKRLLWPTAVIFSNREKMTDVGHSARLGTAADIYFILRIICHPEYIKHMYMLHSAVRKETTRQQGSINCTSSCAIEPKNKNTTEEAKKILNIHKN